MHLIRDGDNGSSPHTRGARSSPLRAPTSTRIIPAYAGSTRTTSTRWTTSTDHPRIRGEHAFGVGDFLIDLGSSPHTRGARQRPAHTEHGHGIIPAYAGSTLSGVRAASRGGDHPRIRGEHSCFSWPCVSCRGSSPHTRGAQDHPRHPCREIGIIPAYAGSTTADGPTAASTRDHPRIRGEHSRARWRSNGGRGSSPHTRGAPWPPTDSTS